MSDSDPGSSSQPAKAPRRPLNIELLVAVTLGLATLAVSAATLSHWQFVLAVALVALVLIPIAVFAVVRSRPPARTWIVALVGLLVLVVASANECVYAELVLHRAGKASPAVQTACDAISRKID